MNLDYGQERSRTKGPGNRPRKPFVAFVLSLFIPGLGQLYNGEPRKAFLFWCGDIVFLTLAIAAHLTLYFWSFVVMCVCGLAFVLYAITDAVRTAGSLKTYTLKPFNRWYVYLAAIAGVLVVGQLVDVGSAVETKAFRTPSESMYPGLHFGDFFMAKRVTAEDYVNNRGDIIVFKYPGDNKTDYVKRVVGFPGEQIEIRGGQLLVDGQIVPDEWAQFTEYNAQASRSKYGPITVPENTLFMLGDNLTNSADSRAWGPLPRENIVGIALYIYFARDKSRIGKSLRVGN